MDNKQSSSEHSSLTKRKRKRKRCNSSDSEEKRRRVSKRDKKKKRYKHKSKTKHKKKRKASNYSSSNSDSDTSTSTSSVEQKIKIKKVKHGKRTSDKTIEEGDSDHVTIGPLPPLGVTDNAKSMAPMTKDEWEKRQNVVKRVFDEETGRWRLVKGDGEILEEIVSRDRHKEINRQATAGDGSFFEKQITNKLKRN